MSRNHEEESKKALFDAFDRARYHTEKGYFQSLWPCFTRKRGLEILPTSMV